MKILKNETFAAMQNEIKNLEKTKLDLIETIGLYKAERDDYSVTVKTLRVANDNLQAEVRKLNLSNDKLQKEKETLALEMIVAKDALQGLTEENDLLAKENVALIEERDDLKKKLARPKPKKYIAVEENVCEKCGECECNIPNDSEITTV